jgi:tRNA threonylcarbamoyladenosine biosynthesis protein TsaE
MAEALTLLQARLADETATARLGTALAATLQPGDWILLKGTLGMGKTALARAILTALGHAGDVPSPSFTLVQSYGAPPCRIGVAHVDLYRLENPRELEALALDELSDEAALLIEWPERMKPWPASALLVEITADARTDSATARTVTLSGNSAWGLRLANFNFL